MSDLLMAYLKQVLFEVYMPALGSSLALSCIYHLSVAAFISSFILVLLIYSGILQSLQSPDK